MRIPTGVRADRCRGARGRTRRGDGGDTRRGLRHARHCAQHRPRREASTRDAAAPAGGRTGASVASPLLLAIVDGMATALLSQWASLTRRSGLERPRSRRDGGALGGIPRPAIRAPATAAERLHGPHRAV